MLLSSAIGVSNSLDPDQDRLSVGPDLGTNCLQSLSSDDKGLPLAKKLLSIISNYLLKSICFCFGWNISELM